ncbi:hypothetical protein GGQ82_004472 [Sphingobium olei]
MRREIADDQQFGQAEAGVADRVGEARRVGVGEDCENMLARPVDVGLNDGRAGREDGHDGLPIS